MTDSRFVQGGFEDRFTVTRKDGKPCNPTARYIVLDYSGRVPHALVALNAYADSVEIDNPTMASDIRAALADPESWPAQHD
jgi:hypothetical protein